MSYYDELDKVLAMTRDRPAGLIPRKSGIDLPRDSEGERLSLSSDPPKKPRLSAHATTPNPRHCESDGKGESSGEQKKGKKSRKRPRSEGSRKRRVAINCKKLRSKILKKRGDECRNRAGLSPRTDAPECPRLFLSRAAPGQGQELLEGRARFLCLARRVEQVPDCFRGCQRLEP